MIQILAYLVFVLTVAMAAGGISLSSRLRSGSKAEIFSYLLYFEVFVYAFGFYGLWGQMLINSLLAKNISSELLSMFSDLSVLLGLPFLVFAWLMLLQFSIRISGRNPAKWFVPVFLVFNFSVIVVIGYLITGKVATDTAVLLKYYFISAHFVWLFVASFFIHFARQRKNGISEKELKIIAPAIFMIMLIQCISLILYSTQVWMALIFIFLFFAGNTFLPIWFSYGSALKEIPEETVNGLTFEGFCKKYDISPRESDIVREICNGLSNKEISDKLFISLQTVKDHTHRIYIKTNVRNRVQLINLVKGGR